MRIEVEPGVRLFVDAMDLVAPHAMQPHAVDGAGHVTWCGKPDQAIAVLRRFITLPACSTRTP
ncbi:MAG: hypothetical protein WCH44_17490 [Betaproteobacteria bacterium]